MPYILDFICFPINRLVVLWYICGPEQKIREYFCYRGKLRSWYLGKSRCACSQKIYSTLWFTNSYFYIYTSTLHFYFLIEHILLNSMETNVAGAGSAIDGDSRYQQLDCCRVLGLPSSLLQQSLQEDAKSIAERDLCSFLFCIIHFYLFKKK